MSKIKALPELQPPSCILLTGAAGFIGSNTLKRLLTEGYEVVGIDNLNDYYDPKVKHRNLEQVKEACPEGTFHFYQEDIRDTQALKEIFAKHPIQGVVHLAAMAGVRASQEDPQLYLDVNLSGTLNLLDCARRHEIKNFVFASTSSVYGNTKVIPFIETDLCDRPLAPYPASKRAAEMLAFSYHHLYQLNIIPCRFFTVYGPMGRPDMMAYKVLDNIFFDRKVPLYNKGQMWRDWTFVDDITLGLSLALKRPMGFEVLNLGRGEPVLLANFIAKIENLTGKKSNLHHEPKMAADIDQSFADVSKAKELIGYQPTISFEEGIERLWDWYQQTVLEQNTLIKQT